uniref:Uncharacterized protein n=1 Tax=Trichogramma kaykai TaxID=54128 RepID=A0ABD2X1A9_9HYME
MCNNPRDNQRFGHEPSLNPISIICDIYFCIRMNIHTSVKASNAYSKYLSVLVSCAKGSKRGEIAFEYESQTDIFFSRASRQANRDDEDKSIEAS